MAIQAKTQYLSSPEELSRGATRSEATVADLLSKGDVAGAQRQQEAFQSLLAEQAITSQGARQRQAQGNQISPQPRSQLRPTGSPTTIMDKRVTDKLAPRGGALPPTNGRDVTGSDFSSLIESRYANLNEGPTAKDMMDAGQQYLQSRLDAINASYDEELANARKNIQRQTGRTQGLNVASGNLYDPTGDARMDDVEAQGQAAISAIERARAAALQQAITGQQNENLGYYREDAARQLQQTQAIVDDLVQVYGLNQAEEQNLRQIALQEALATGNVGGNQTLDALRLGLSRDQFAVDTDLAYAQNERANEQLALDVEAARRSGFSPQQFADGTVGYWDFSGETPNFVEIGNYARPVSSGGGGGGSSSSSGAPAGLEGLALLRYQQATGTIPAESSQPGVVNAFLSAYNQADPRDFGSYGPAFMPVDPYAIDNPFSYPSRGGGADGGNAALQQILIDTLNSDG